ncbi:MaoC/PaaZ C-terminal domain-containing protein [Amycolatopsis rhabdoformis]|uniref:MaoC/PaaZ C-terminal domain-containing protein n=1 Tax=Amycolatopsis rhabdoformis TaxID=1448059 RepID=A0ABZ1I710_9PSEU|nr:MaoC/PaaZ C-terminal domain-containing protein [Amycolatopsis rhabdoformis]WSE29658.1 MaoC/PaaZ C-terminal domain-containing protein [Amycolatopsis rhabdoformis]
MTEAALLPEVGTVLPEREFPIGRADLVRYAGASGDFNPIHWNDRAARAAGLSGVIAHGMLTMGLAARVLAEWAGGADAVEQYRVRFRRPVEVPDDGVVTVSVRGVVTARQPDGRVTVELTVHGGGKKVLSAASAVLRPR